MPVAGPRCKGRTDGVLGTAAIVGARLQAAIASSKAVANAAIAVAVALTGLAGGAVCREALGLTDIFATTAGTASTVLILLTGSRAITVLDQDRVDVGLVGVGPHRDT